MGKSDHATAHFLDISRAVEGLICLLSVGCKLVSMLLGGAAAALEGTVLLTQLMGGRAPTALVAVVTQEVATQTAQEGFSPGPTHTLNA